MSTGDSRLPGADDDLVSPEPRTVTESGRKFSVRIFRMVNGCILFVSEGEEARIGSITIAAKSGGRTISPSTALPGRFGDLLAGILAEYAAGICGGVAVVSLYLASEVDEKIVRRIVAEVAVAAKG